MGGHDCISKDYIIMHAHAQKLLYFSFFSLVALSLGYPDISLISILWGDKCTFKS